MPFCSACGRCPACGKLRPLDLEPCECGHPQDPEKVARVERSFGIGAKPTPANGCWGIALIVAAAALLLLIYWLS